MVARHRLSVQRFCGVLALMQSTILSIQMKERFQIKFPVSEIAETFACGKDKTGYGLDRKSLLDRYDGMHR